MKLDKALLLEKLDIVLAFLKRFRFIMIFMVFSLMYGYILVQVTALSEQTPSEKAITEKISTSSKPKIDPDLIDQIKSMEAENIQAKTVFNEARKNPFNE